MLLCHPIGLLSVLAALSSAGVAGCDALLRAGAPGVATRSDWPLVRHRV
jgi:hypothetical protein